MNTRARKTSWLCAGIVVALQPFACSEGTIATPGQETSSKVPKHVLVLTVDTLRADYLSSAGYPLPTTPAIDALSQNATVFRRAVTPIPRTTPALASLLTGRYPHRTGVRSLLDRLSESATSLAEIAKENGFATVAVVSNHILTEQRGLGRGFDVYDAAGDHRTAAATTAAALEATSTLDSQDAIFAWVHYIDPHVPYLPESSTVDNLLPPYEGRYARSFGAKHGGTGNAAYPPDLPKRIAVFENPLSDVVNARVAQLYAADIRDTDDAISELLEVLKEKFGDDWVIVFTSDHGESLGERDYYYYDHGDYVYDATTRIPLAIQMPRNHALHRGRVVHDWVSLVDVAPTLIELLNWDASSLVTSSFEGRSLAPYLHGSPLDGVPVFAESGRSYFPGMIRGRARFDVEGRFRAVWKGDWKLIWTPFAVAGHEFQLYNVEQDPDELVNVAAERADKVGELRGELVQWMQRPSKLDGGNTPTPKEVELLRSLGYVE